MRGPNNVNAKLLLAKFFNLCFMSGINPTDWDDSDIVPIPKKDKDERDPLQNRCITIVCCVAKIYSYILNKRLQTFLEKNKILAEEQNGFRIGRSCIDHLYIMCTVLRNRKAMGKETFLCFIDYKKAFDSVNRNMMMFKLSRVGINGHMYNAISSLYSNPRSRVLLQGYYTDYFECPVGVKQGDCLSPTLFSVFINDLASEIKDTGIGVKINLEDESGLAEIIVLNILMYADDVVLFSENESDMQDLLLIVQGWCNRWRLTVNLTKTNILHIRPKRRPQSRFMFLLGNQPVQYCQFYKYLGCYLNEYLDFNFTAKMQADSAGRALGSIITKMIKNKGLPYSVYTILYQSCVSSISQYGSEVYGFSQYDAFFKLHLRAARSYLGLPKNVTSFGLVSEIDWLLPQYETQLKMVRFLGRLYSMPGSRLIKRVFDWDRNLNESGIISTWSSEVRNILNSNNMISIFESKIPFPVKSTIAHLRSSMQLKQREMVKQECASKPKLRTFVLFKDYENLAPHIGKPITFIERKTLSKLRLGILPLRLETARFQRPVLPEDQRLCYCNSGETESEQHVLFHCGMYDNLRQTWFSKLNVPFNFNDMTMKEKLKLVLNDANNVRPTAQFVLSLMDLRSLKNKAY